LKVLITSPSYAPIFLFLCQLAHISATPEGFIRSFILRYIYFGDEAIDSLVVLVQKLRLYFVVVLADPGVHFLLGLGFVLMDVFLFLG